MTGHNPSHRRSATIDTAWQPIETMPKGVKVEGDLGDGRTIIGRTVPRSKFGDHNTVTDSNGTRHVVYRWRLP